MKAFNLVAREREFSFGVIPVIELGERGRGRWQEIIPCPLEIQTGEPVSLGVTRSGKPKIIRGGDGKGWLARVSTLTAYIRCALGTVYAPVESQVEVVANGYGAFGLAGRVGTWFDYLLKVPDNTLLRVKPSRGDAWYLWFPKSGEPKKISLDEIAVFLDMYPDASHPEMWLDLNYKGGEYEESGTKKFEI